MNGQKTPITYKPKSKVRDYDEIPEFLFASDGRQFFPCKFCCLAFADKNEQIQHMRTCNFKEDLPVALVPPQAKARKSFAKPPTAQVQSPSLNGLMKPKLPKTLKPKPNSNLITINKAKFPKIKLKLNPVAIIEEPRFSEDDSDDPTIPPNVCMTCGEAFVSKILLSQHKRDAHPKIYVPTEALSEYDVLFKRSDQSKCVICEKPVIKPQWARHLATHADEKSYGCSFCLRKFRRKDQRNVHEKTHTSPL